MRLFVPRDLDGFFGLFVDNLVQLLLIMLLCSLECGMKDSDLLYRVVLPGAAVSILVGNLFYAWQAHQLARREGRDDVTALPYGINTVSLLVYVHFVMAPIYQKTGSADAAWRMGMLACLGCGVIELLGSLVAERIRRHTPRAALLATLAGIAIGFIAMSFALQIWAQPLLAMPPMALVLITYFSNVRFPWGLPGGLIALITGTAIAWSLYGLSAFMPDLIPPLPVSAANVAATWAPQWMLPVWCGSAIATMVTDWTEWLPYMSVIIPMGLFNVLGSLQNVESAEASGDRFAAGPSLAANGIGTIVAALFGSCFPTTIYIGHPGWKGLGARAGYSTLNGIVITLICLTGVVPGINSVIPMEAGIAIVLWIGIVITAQAFQATPTDHAPAVALGLFPAIAAWGATVSVGAFIMAGGHTVQQLLQTNPNTILNGYLLHGLIALERGYIFTCMVVAALSVCLIERRFTGAAIWSLVGAFVTALGLCHAYQITGNDVDYLLVFYAPTDGAHFYRAFDLALGYVLMALIFWGIGATCKTSDGPTH